MLNIIQTFFVGRSVCAWKTNVSDMTLAENIHTPIPNVWPILPIDIFQITIFAEKLFIKCGAVRVEESITLPKSKHVCKFYDSFSVWSTRIKKDTHSSFILWIFV